MVAWATSSRPSRQSRPRKRRPPSIISSVCSVQSKSSVGGPTKRWNSRRASAPTVSKYLAGAIRLPLDLDILVPPMRIMPWVNKRLNGSRRPFGVKPDVAEGTGVEAGVEQVQDGVLDAADVLVDRHPVIGRVQAEGNLGCPGVAEAQEVPGRVHEGVHGVGLPLGRTAALGADGVAEALVVLAAATPRSGETRRRRAPAPAALTRAPGPSRRRGSRRSGWDSPRSAAG